MRSKGHSQNKFVRFIAIPIRVLGKARDLYVRSMTGCATRSRVNYGSNSMALPRSFSAVSSSASMSNDSEDYRDLIRAASVRSLGHRNELEYMLFQHQQEIMRQSTAVMMDPSSKSNGSLMSKSSSVAMGRIDEDRACDFEEDDDRGVNVRADLLFPRSKSYAVAKRNVMI